MELTENLSRKLTTVVVILGWGIDKGKKHLHGG